MIPRQGSERQSFACAFIGIVKACAIEKHMRFHIVTAIAVLLAALFFRVAVWEWVAVLLSIALVLGAELLNSAIEAVVDLVSPEKNPLAAYAKDAAAGGVLVAAFAAALVGCIVFIPKIWLLVQGFLK